MSASADTPVKQSAAYFDLNGSGTILNAFEGKQQEYVYFGMNGSSVKWRVLAKNDSKYGIGNNLLLWANSSIAADKFNIYYNNPEYAFWGTSYLRAKLNGGSYVAAVNNTTDVPDVSLGIAEDNSWYATLFNTEERAAVLSSKSYATDNYGIDTSDTYHQENWRFYKQNIVSDSDGANGKYYRDRINATSHPASQYASITGTSPNEGVSEMTGGDKLFILDYYDLNNVLYGFGDGGLTYALKINPSWTPSSNWFPAHYDGGQGSVRSTYLANEGDYWVRSVCRAINTGSNAMIVSSTGTMGANILTSSFGVRPAFNLDTSKVAYVTTVKPVSGWTDMSQTSVKPEYKLYIKDSGYTSVKAAVAEKDGTLNIRYNNPTGKTGGKLILLLSDKTKDDGAVAYQTTIAMNSTSAADNVFTTVALPSGVSLSTHNLAMMYASANGGDKTETVYCSYDVNSGIDAPNDITTGLTYEADKSKWIVDLPASDNYAWLDLNIYNNPAFIKEVSISYKDNLGNPATTVGENQVIAAGEYEVTMTIADGLKWTGNATTGGDKTFKIKIGKKDSSVTAEYATLPNNYVPDELPAISLKSGSTAGTIDWDDEQKIESGNKSYTWTFTPTDTNNYTKVEGSKSFNFVPREVESVTIKSFNPTGTIYTNTTETVLKSYMTVEIKYVSFSETITLDPGDYELQINSNNKLKAGENKLKVKYGNKWSAEFPISGVVELSYKTISNIVLSDDTFTYPVTESEILAKITSVDVEMNDGGSDSLTAEQIASLMEIDGDLTAGTKDVTFKIKDSDAETDYEITINQGTLTPTVTFEDLTVTYDGSAKKIEATVTGLPEGLTLTPAYTVTGSATTYNAAGYTDAGTYNYSVTFTHTNGNYAQYTTPSTAILKIDKATVTGIVFEDAVKPEITDVTYTLEATGYPLWVNVTYSVTDEENNPLTGTSFSAAGTYKFTATFTIDAAHVNNYEAIAPITKTLTISDKPPVAGADDIVVPPTITATYTGSPVDYAAQNVPGGVDVSYTIVKKDDAAFSGKDIINVGEYTVTVSFETGAAYAPIASKTCVVTVGKATVDMDGVEFADKTVTGNGQAHKVEATNLPQGVTVEYEYKGVKQATPFEFTEVGEYTVKAYFTYEDEDNYETIEPAEATLTVSDAVVESISAKVENGAVFTTASTLDDLKAKLTVTAVYNNGTTAEVDNFELSCDGLRDGGKFKYSLQKITVKYTSEGEEFSTFVEINVEKQKVALPTFKGGLKYTGVSVKPTVDNFNGYDADLMTLVDDKTVPGLAVGSYKAVFALNDYENYEWATTTTLKKSVFAVALYDEEITLLANEAAVDWNIAKAVLTATKKENALPVFASESYIGAFSDVVALKYYTDEDCTEEIAAEDLKYETQYYVKAELIDTDNFELDASAAAYTVKSFTYTTPAKELTGFEKILAVIKANWLWIVIAAVALILLILIIALAVRSAKKKREREEQRRLEEKEEKKREQEERERREEERRQREEERRREEREERMAARMAMPQMMPQMPQQMPQMSQQMPQSMPAAQPMATGGASSNEIAELKAEMAAMKATQDMAKEIAELRMEVMRAEQNAVMRSDVNALRFGGEQAMQGGVTLQALTELIRTEVRNALADEKSAAQTAAPEGAATAATQVPPDAVMTTVTTTKIDTTKKQPQATQTAAPVRTVVRNVVAPMPVDDGRVFDVGGFYKPADPVTDMGFTDEENKD